MFSNSRTHSSLSTPSTSSWGRGSSSLSPILVIMAAISSSFFSSSLFTIGLKLSYFFWTGAAFGASLTERKIKKRWCGDRVIIVIITFTAYKVSCPLAVDWHVLAACSPHLATLVQSELVPTPPWCQDTGRPGSIQSVEQQHVLAFLGQINQVAR